MSKRSGQEGQVFLRNNRWVGRYYVDVFGQDNRTRKAVVLGSKRGLTKTAARMKLKNLLAAEGVNTPEHLEHSLTPLAPTLTFNDVADAWEAKKLPELKPSTRYAAPQMIANYLRPFFGTMPLDTIRTGIINDWLLSLKPVQLQPKTVHNIWKQFRAIMNWHAQQKDEPKRAFYPTLPVIPEDEQRWFTQQESQRIVDAAHGQYKVLFHLAGRSGLRFGELAGLHVEDIDFGRGVIRVRRSVWRGEETTTKTRKGYRDVFVDSVTLRMIRERLGTRTAGRVFETKNGTPLENHNVVRQVLKPICKRLGIAPGGMHAFRHGRVSYLQASNVPSDFTKGQVGHSSLRTTSGYTHFTEQFMRETVEKLATEMQSWTQSPSLDSLEIASN